MNFYRGWIEKPRRVLLLLSFICVVSLLFALSIPLGYLPHPVAKTVAITIEFRGAFAPEIERLIVVPLEAGLGAVEGITEIFSVAERGRARLNITFSGQTDLDQAFLSVRDIVYAACTSFPPEVQRPVILKSDPTGKPVLIAGFPSHGELSEEDLKRIFENVEGSGEVIVAGSSKPEVIVRYDPQKLSARSLGSADLIRSLRGTNILGGFGLECGGPYLIDNRIRSVDQALDLMIADGIRLGEVATVDITNRPPEVIGRINGRERLILYVQPEGGANVLDLCDRLERVMANLADGEIVYSYGRQVRSALGQIFGAAAISIGCVLLLTMFFLGRAMPGLLVSANIPFSILVTLAILRISGEELNVLSLSGIVVGVGLVIDAGVVFVEEFFQTGGSSRKSIRRSCDPILFSAATTTAVFLPLLFAPPILVDQLKGLALAITGSVAASCLFVFCFLPAFLRRLYGPFPTGRRTRPIVNKGIPVLLPQGLMLSLNRFRLPMVISGLALSGVAAVVALGLNWGGVGFSGVNEEVMHFSIEYPAGHTLEAVFGSAAAIEADLLNSTGVSRVSSRYERERASFVAQLDTPAAKEQLYSGLRNTEPDLGEGFLFFPDGTSELASFPVVLSGIQSNELQRLARVLAGEIQRLPHCREVLLHFKSMLPARNLHVDLEKAARAGVDPQELHSQMFGALSRPVIDKWTSGPDEMDIVLRTGRGDGETESLSSLLQLLAGKTSVPIAALVRVSERPQLGRIYHLDRARSVRISVLTERKHKGSVVEGTRKILSSFSFPFGYRGEIGRELDEQRLLSRTVIAGLGLSILLIFFILMFQFESLPIAAIILLQIPGSFLCPILLLKILSWSLTLPVMVGLILTSGIAVNNAILVFVELRDTRLTVARVHQALAVKLRPLVVSSLSTIVGVLPLLLSGSANRGILAPLSLTVAAGIAGSLVVLVATLAVVAAGE